MFFHKKITHLKDYFHIAKLNMYFPQSFKTCSTCSTTFPYFSTKNSIFSTVLHFFSTKFTTYFPQCFNPFPQHFHNVYHIFSKKQLKSVEKNSLKMWKKQLEHVEKTQLKSVEKNNLNIWKKQLENVENNSLKYGNKQLENVEKQLKRVEKTA